MDHVVYCLLAFGKATVKAYICICFKRQCGWESYKLYSKVKTFYSHLEAKMGTDLQNAIQDKFKTREWQKYVLTYCEKMDMAVEKDLSVACMAKLIVQYKNELEEEAKSVHGVHVTDDHYLVKLQTILSNGISINLLKCVEHNRVSLIGRQALNLFTITDEINELLHFELEDKDNKSLLSSIHQMGRILSIICKNDPISSPEGLCNHVDMADCNDDVDWVAKHAATICENFINLLGIPGFNYVHTLVSHMVQVLKDEKTLGIFSGSHCESVGAQLKVYLHSYSICIFKLLVRTDVIVLCRQYGIITCEKML